MVLHLLEQFPLSFPLCATNINKGNVRAVLPVHPCGALVLVEALLSGEEGTCYPHWLLSSTRWWHRPHTLDERRGRREGEEERESHSCPCPSSSRSICRPLCLPQLRNHGGTEAKSLAWKGWANPDKDNFVKLWWSNTKPSSACRGKFLSSLVEARRPSASTSHTCLPCSLRFRVKRALLQLMMLHPFIF